MSIPIKVAILLTTFNRKEKTLACLQSIHQMQLPQNVQLEIFMTDDASSDGTAEAVKQQYPHVHVFNGTGSLFWAGGMRFTWKHALSIQPQYYLLINDDTILSSNALVTLLKCTQQKSTPTICIGSTVDAATGKTSYGGSRLTSKRKWKSSMIEAPQHFMQCDFGNANIMLVSAEVVDTIGILSEGYTHGLADFDYTLKAKKAGINVMVAPGSLGTCTDDHGNNWKSHNIPLKQRIQYMKSPKGLAYSEYLKFIRRHFPLYYPVAFFKLWLKTFFPFLWDTLKAKPTIQQTV